MRRTLVALFLLPATIALADDASNYMSGVSACFDTAAKTGVLDCVGQASNLCQDKMPDGYSTFGMSQCSKAETDAWDMILSREYKAALETAKSIDESGHPSPAGNAVEVVRTAQRAWLALRDAQCQMDYVRWGGGSMRVIAGGDCLELLTAQRALDLHSWNHIEPEE